MTDILDQFVHLLPESSRIEYIEGTFIVNPPPIFEHARIISKIRHWLYEELNYEAFENVGISYGEQGWIIPDLIVFKKEVDSSLWKQPADSVLLVVEVISQSSKEIDSNLKRKFYHNKNIQYLLVDLKLKIIYAYDTTIDENKLAYYLWR